MSSGMTQLCLSAWRTMLSINEKTSPANSRSKLMFLRTSNLEIGQLLVIVFLSLEKMVLRPFLFTSTHNTTSILDLVCRHLVNVSADSRLMFTRISSYEQTRPIILYFVCVAESCFQYINGPDSRTRVQNSRDHPSGRTSV
jgi:hypothetical protein